MAPSPTGSARWWGHQGVSIYYLAPPLLGPLGLDVGEVGVPCYVAMATTPTPTPLKAHRDSFHPPHSQERPGCSWEPSLGNPLSDAQAMVCITITLFSATRTEGWEAGASSLWARLCN